MYKQSLLAAAIAAVPALANPQSPSPGINVYWGQKGNIMLKEWCDTVPFEYVTISFINNSPENDPSELHYPGSNFGAHCSGYVYADSNNVDSKLNSKCNFIAEDIPYCQSKGKKVLLSIGGAVGNYDVTGSTEGEYFAEFMFNAFGPYNAAKPEPRPFDYENGGEVVHVSVDGFDFDIEHKPKDSGEGYIAMVAKLNELIDGCGKKYLVTAAPECPLNPEFFKMKSIIDASKFDLLFIQFYNNPSCQGDSPTFNFEDWVDYLVGKPSEGAKLFLGLPGDSTVESAGSGYLDGETACALVKDLKKSPSFGGVMLWDIVTSSGHDVEDDVSYLEYLHKCVVGSTTVPNPGGSTTITATTTSTTDSATSTTAAATTTDDDYCWEEPTDSATTTTTDSTTSATDTATTTTTDSATSTTDSVTATTTSTTDDDYCWEEPTDGTTDTTASSTATDTTTTSATDATSATTSGWDVTSTTTSDTATITDISSSITSWPSVSITYVTLTTSTVFTTSCETVTSCAPGGNCGVQVVTHTIAVSTTVCPVTLTEATWTPKPTGSWPSGWTTSTLYSTKTYTITSCAPSVTNCPGHFPHVTTEVVPVGTTVCPISDSGAWPKPTGTGKPIIVPTWQPEGDWTSKTQLTNTQFTTLTVPKPDWPVSGGGAAPSWSKPAAGSGATWPSGAASPSGSKPAGTVSGSLPVVTAGAARNSVALGLTGLVAVLLFAL